jgi:hypothetical protein
MQNELETAYPQLEIQLLGVNGYGHQGGNAAATAGRDIPLLQDVDSDGANNSHAWDLWDVTYRDVVILDDENVPVGVYNLTEHDLADPDSYATLRQMLIDAALAVQEPELAAGDANGDSRFDQLDLFQVLRGGKFGTGQTASWDEGDWNGDQVFDQLDVLAALQTGNYLKGPYAADTESADEGSLLSKSDAPIDRMLLEALDPWHEEVPSRFTSRDAQ